MLSLKNDKGNPILVISWITSFSFLALRPEILFLREFLSGGSSRENGYPFFLRNSFFGSQKIIV